MIMESAVNQLEKSMTKADAQMGNLAEQVVQLETELSSDQGCDIQVFSLLQSVQNVKENYSSLQRDVLEVRNQQRELSTTIQKQIALMQSKCNFLREKLSASPASVYPGKMALQSAESDLSLSTLDVDALALPVSQYMIGRGAEEAEEKQ